MDWIPVSERQPDKDGDYLVWDGETGITVDTFYTHDGTEEYGFKTFAGWQGGRVTAWMPLPQPYKAD